MRKAVAHAITHYRTPGDRPRGGSSTTALSAGKCHFPESRQVFAGSSIVTSQRPASGGSKDASYQPPDCAVSNFVWS